MGYNYHCLLVLCCCLIIVIIELGSPCLSATDGPRRRPDTRRLVAKIRCPLDLESMNYTTMTSQCKGPDYTAKACCGAFKEFACPIVDYIGNQSYDCAVTMFSYMHLYGKYPAGLFANLCNEASSEGLDCSNVATWDPSSSSTRSHLLLLPSSSIFGLLIFLLHLLF